MSTSLMQVCPAFRDKTLTLALEIFDNLREGLFEVLDFALQVFRLCACVFYVCVCGREFVNLCVCLCACVCLCV